MVRIDNVRSEYSERLSAPVFNLAFGRSGTLKRFEHFIHRKILCGACLGQRLLAAAAIVNTECFKYANRGGVLQSYVANSLCGYSHFDLHAFQPRHVTIGPQRLWSL